MMEDWRKLSPTILEQFINVTKRKNEKKKNENVTIGAYDRDYLIDGFAVK